jgi:hypothetical protein
MKSRSIIAISLYLSSASIADAQQQIQDPATVELRRLVQEQADHLERNLQTKTSKTTIPGTKSNKGTTINGTSIGKSGKGTINGTAFEIAFGKSGKGTSTNGTNSTSMSKSSKTTVFVNGTAVDGKSGKGMDSNSTTMTKSSKTMDVNGTSIGKSGKGTSTNSTNSTSMSKSSKTTVFVNGTAIDGKSGKGMDTNSTAMAKSSKTMDVNGTSIAEGKSGKGMDTNSTNSTSMSKSGKTTTTRFNVNATKASKKNIFT